MSDYIVHKAVELKNVLKTCPLALALKANPQHLEQHYWRQLKYDGCNCVVVSYGGGDFEVYSRTGEVVRSMDHLRVDLEKMEPGVYLGEAWLPNTPFPEISGIFRRQKPKEGAPLLQLIVFDCLTIDEWAEGHSQYPYEKRIERNGIRKLWLRHIKSAYTWTRGLQESPEWEDEGMAPNATPEEMALHLQACGGYDGLILRDPEGTWTKGDEGRNGEIIKVKPRMRVSCQVIGYIEGKGKHAGTIGTLLVEYGGKEQGAGTGLKDHERDITCFGMNWRNKIVEIEALGVTADGYLREPVLLGVRTDVVEPD